MLAAPGRQARQGMLEPLAERWSEAVLNRCDVCRTAPGIGGRSTDPLKDFRAGFVCLHARTERRRFWSLAACGEAKALAKVMPGHRSTQRPDHRQRCRRPLPSTERHPSHDRLRVLGLTRSKPTE